MFNYFELNFILESILKQNFYSKLMSLSNKKSTIFLENIYSISSMFDLKFNMVLSKVAWRIQEEENLGGLFFWQWGVKDGVA